MRKLIIIATLLGMILPTAQAKDLVAYFSAQGNTKAVAERIAELTGADLYRIEAADPYATNPYDDSDRIQEEAFFTYGATTYLNESMQKIYRCTPNSVHVPETLPEDLDPDDITTPGRPDDAGIDMPGNANGVAGWLERLGLTGESGIAETGLDSPANVRIYSDSTNIRIDLDSTMSGNTVEIYNMNGTLLHRMSDLLSYSFSVPVKSVYLCSLTYGGGHPQPLQHRTRASPQLPGLPDDHRSGTSRTRL